jgi:hypothetical protein
VRGQAVGEVERVGGRAELARGGPYAGLVEIGEVEFSAGIPE